MPRPHTHTHTHGVRRVRSSCVPLSSVPVYRTIRLRDRTWFIDAWIRDFAAFLSVTCIFFIFKPNAAMESAPMYSFGSEPVQYQIPRLVRIIITMYDFLFAYNTLSTLLCVCVWFRLNVRKYAFSNRVIDNWNLLPANCVNCSTINTFKKHLSSELESEAVKFKVSQLW